jgi:group I intron endonuclease
VRWRKHRNELRQGKHYASYLQRAWKKHGEDAFEFSVIEVVDNPDLLFIREQWWIDTTNCCDNRHGYNTSPVAGGTRGVKHSSESRRHMSNAHKGKPKSQAHVRNQANAIAEEWILISPNNEELRIKNLLSFCREHAISAAALCEVANGNRKSHKGWRCVRVRDRNAAGRLQDARTYHFAPSERHYVVTSPTGQMFQVCGLKAFCVQAGLSDTAMVGVARGRRKHHLGWRCIYDKEFNE